MVIYYKIVEEGLPSNRSFCRDKEFSPCRFPPPLLVGGIPSKKSFRRLVANETKRYFYEGILLWVHPQKKVLVVLLPTRQRYISLRVYYFCRLIVCGTKIIYNKSLPVNFVGMFKINTRKL